MTDKDRPEVGWAPSPDAGAAGSPETAIRAADPASPAPLPSPGPDTAATTREVAKNLEFSLFYQANLPHLVAFLIVHGARAGQAADLAQEAMTEAYRRWEQINAPRAWVRIVASRLWWRRNEAEEREQPHEQVPERPALLPEQLAAEVEARHDFVALARQLPMRQRQVMAWTYSQYTPTEIAEALGLPPDRVRANLRKARQKIIKLAAERRTP